MYLEIEQEIVKLQEEFNYQVAYWFELGESDRSYGLPPQYPENPWYSLGYHDRDYQLEIGFNPETPIFDHF